MLTAALVLDKLAEKANPDNLPEMARFGMAVEKRLGVSVPAMRQIAKEIGHNHELALALWETGIADARIVASMIDTPHQVSPAQADQWVHTFNSWDVCDQVCLNLFEKTSWAWLKVPEWAESDEEYVKRAAFVLIARLALRDKQATNEQFIQLFPLLKNAASDERNFVKKAVNWALRNIGKRNLHLNLSAIQLAKEIQQINSKAAQWIAVDAIRELDSNAVQQRLNGNNKKNKAA